MIVCSLCVLLCNVIYLNVAFFIKLTMAVTIFIVYNVIFHVGQSTILPQSYSEARYLYTLFLIFLLTLFPETCMVYFILLRKTTLKCYPLVFFETTYRVLDLHLM